MVSVAGFRAAQRAERLRYFLAREGGTLGLATGITGQSVLSCYIRGLGKWPGRTAYCTVLMEFQQQHDQT